MRLKREQAMLHKAGLTSLQLSVADALNLAHKFRGTAREQHMLLYATLLCNDTVSSLKLQFVQPTLDVVSTMLLRCPNLLELDLPSSGVDSKVLTLAALWCPKLQSISLCGGLTD